MKIYKSLILLLSVSAFILSVSSCTDRFLDYNTPTTGATDDEMERDAYAARTYMLALQGAVIPAGEHTNQFTDCLLGGNYGRYLADSNEGFNNINFSTYSPKEDWREKFFVDVMSELLAQYTYVGEVTTDPNMLGIAKIMQLMGLHRVTDVYGPIPYSQAGVEGKLQIPYDSQEDVYKLMIEELTNTIDILTTNSTANISAKADRVYGGNTEKWIKLGNSLKLRLAMRMSGVAPAESKRIAEEVMLHPIGPITSNADNAFMSLSGQNPFHKVMYEFNGGDSRICADLTVYMNGYNDPRREKYFVIPEASSTNEYIGIRTGITIPADARIKNYANMNVTASSKLMWMNAAEVAFLRAEGALKGWNMGGTAEDLYKEGITLSFEQWGASGAEAYMTDNSSKPTKYTDPLGFNSTASSPSDVTIKWDGAATEEMKLEKIITQKWIANFPLGVEAWSEYRRTGYPKFIRASVNTSGGVVSSERGARRVTYPQREYETNKENVTKAVNQYLNGPDNMATDLWWAKKN